MENVISISSILAALLIGAMSPGPSFIVIAQTSIAGSRYNGVAMAMAMGLGFGSVLFGAFALLGLHILLEQVSWAYVSFKVLGGGYLLFLAYKIWRGANTPIKVDRPANEETNRPLTSFIRGTITQLSNPKTALVFASVFATFLKTDISFALSTLLLALIFIMETCWYSLIVIAFSSAKPRRFYMASKSWLDRTAALVIGGLGLKLIFDR